MGARSSGGILEALARNLVVTILDATNYFEKGYISHANPTPAKTNSKNDHTAYLIRSVVVRRARQPSATETNSANRIIAEKWLAINAAGT